MSSTRGSDQAVSCCFPIRCLFEKQAFVLSPADIRGEKHMCLLNIEKQRECDDRSFAFVDQEVVKRGNEQQATKNLVFKTFLSPPKIFCWRSGLQVVNVERLLDVYCELLLCLLFSSPFHQKQQKQNKDEEEIKTSVDLHKHLDPREKKFVDA